MAKQSGIGMTVLTVQDSGGVAQAVINDITNFNFSTPRGVQDVTGVDKSAIERILLLADFSATLNGVANFATNAEHDVFKTVTSTSVSRQTVITFAVLGGGTKTMTATCLYTDYQLTRAQTGELTWSAPGVLASGVIPAWT